MPRFFLSKVDEYRNTQPQGADIIKLKFPSELKDIPASKKDDLLVFVVDDDPFFLQIINTHFSKLELKTDGEETYKFKVKNFATGKSCLQNLHLNPDLILLNFYINKGLANEMSGKDILDHIVDTNPNQKILILNDIGIDLREAFVENGLRDYIIQDNEALDKLNQLIVSILNQ